jgi:hypothetical protein
MHDKLCERMMLGRMGRDFDWLGGPEVGISNVTIGLQSFAYEHNFAWDFQAATRWAIMVRQYVDPLALDDCLSRIETHMGKKRGVAALRLSPDTVSLPDPDEDTDLNAGEHLQTNMVKERFIGKRMSRRWGSCMLSLTYRNVPRPTVTLNSRTSYFGMLAMMDVTVANVFARMCGERTGYDVGEMQFVWQLNLAQWHGFRSLAWALTDVDAKMKLDAYVDRRDDITKQAGLWRSVTGYRRIVRLDREGVLYGDEKFASALRMRKRYHVEIKGPKYAQRFAGGTLHPEWGKPFTPLADLWSQDLTFSPIGR